MAQRASRFKQPPSYFTLLLDLLTGGYVQTPVNIPAIRFSFLDNTIFESRPVLIIAMIIGTFFMLASSPRIGYLDATYPAWNTQYVIVSFLLLIVGLALFIFGVSRWNKKSIKK